jgi:hypothetical protein
LFNVTISDEKRDIMIIHNSVLLKAERELVTAVVKMTRVLAAFLIKPYESGLFQPDIIPTHFNQLGRHWEYTTTGFQKYTATAEQLALLSGYNSSESNPVIRTCCDLVKGVCELEQNIVTKIQWASLPTEKHPDGIIGHVYDVLFYYGEKCVQEKVLELDQNIAEEFRERFQSRCDSLLERSHNLSEKARECSQAGNAVIYLKEALDLISPDPSSDSALTVVKDVTTFLENMNVT